MPIPNDVDAEKLTEAVLGILWLSAHRDGDQTRVWKGVDWDVMHLLHDKGWISDPRSKAKSVLLTEEGKELAPKLLEKHFGPNS